MRRLPRRILAVAGVAAAAAIMIAGAASPAQAHDERPTVPVSGNGHVPEYRTGGPTELVCKTDSADFARRLAGYPDALKARNEQLFTQCQSDGFRDLQAAVDAVHTAGVRILVLPGVYQELPSFAPPTAACASLPARWSKYGYQILSWEQQNECPHNQNMVAILSKQDLQIEGTGSEPTDVMFDGRYQILNAIRADRSDGVYFYNLAAERTQFNAFYIMETDGFVLNKTVGRWNDEYAFLTFADDHGLYENCEAYGNGDSGIYPGAAHNINVNEGHTPLRYAIEVRRCYSHDNTLGYSGTAGDSVWAHDNTFVNNETGVSTDSAFPNHPGMPQNHALFEHNVIAYNNRDYNGYVRDGTCTKDRADRGYERGVVCPSVGLPSGTGIINPGGNWNVWRDNQIYGNHYVGVLTSWVPGFIRDDTSWAAQFDTSHHNRYVGNVMGVNGDGDLEPNGIDFWWDGQGLDNCWQPDRPDGTEPLAIPACGPGWSEAALGTARYVAEPMKIIQLYDCSLYDLPTQQVPAGCEWFGARGLSRLDVQISAGEAVLTAILVALVLWRLVRTSWIAAGMGIVGAVAGVIGQAYEGTAWSAVGLGLLGGWWLAIGLEIRRDGRRRLGWLTVALGVVALINALDRSLLMLPWVPFSPSYLRIVLELVWIPWLVVAAAAPKVAGWRNRRPEAGDAEGEPAVAEDDSEPAGAPTSGPG